MTPDPYQLDCWAWRGLEGLIHILEQRAGLISLLGPVDPRIVESFEKYVKRINIVLTQLKEQQKCTKQESIQP